MTTGSIKPARRRRNLRCSFGRNVVVPMILRFVIVGGPDVSPDHRGLLNLVPAPDHDTNRLVGRDAWQTGHDSPQMVSTMW
jgi:hypothetical protein